MSFEKPTEASTDQPKPNKLIRSQFKDVVVKVDDDVYYLDRLQLALKSAYFEKLFTEDNSDLIEISQIDTKTFSAAIDVIYGEQLESVINDDNVVSLLIAMDYLQMNIDPETYKTICGEKLGRYMPLHKDAFKLYNFIANDAKYEYLWPVVNEHLSEHLEELQNSDELLSIEFDHFKQIISHQKSYYEIGTAAVDTSYPFRTISKICSRWICHDMENRSKRVLSLLNSARCRFSLSNNISDKEFKLRWPVNDENTNQNSILRYFCNGLMCSGEIRCPKPVASKTLENECIKDEDEYDRDQSDPVPFVFSSEPKLKTFLENNDYYDITVKVGEKMYKLHRPVLKSESLYFKELFSKEYSELAAQCEGIPILPRKDEIYTIDGIEIDSTTFDLIVDHMYLGKVHPTNDVILRLFKAAHMLKIDSLKSACRCWLRAHSEEMCAEHVVEILNFTHANTEYKDLNRVFLSKYIVDSWPKIENLPQFADLFKAIVIPEGADSCENGEFLFDEVDQETFKFIINYIYFYQNRNVDGLNKDNLARVLKASDMFKIEKLIKECVKRLMWWQDEMSPTDVKEVLNVTLKNAEYYEALNTAYLAKHVMEWPEVDIELFCTISYDYLENMLMSNNLCLDDPRVLLDICSKWVMYDVENRYSLIPRIALAISRNRVAELDDYSIAHPSNWKDCSQDFIKEKIGQVLASTSILPFESLSEDEIKRRKLELPVFITSKMGRSFSVLNADWDEIVSFRLGENIRDVISKMFYLTRYPMAATIMNDNLFILYCMRQYCSFYAYNFSSEKLFSLASDLRIFKENKRYLGAVHLEFSLLNCCNNIYYCREDGLVLKYSFEFNRWMKISANIPDKDGIRFASDGNALFRMFEMARTDTETNYTVEVYDFEQNIWVSTPLPSLTRHHESYEKSEEYRKLHELDFLQNYGLAALFNKRLLIFDQETRIWKKISLPYAYESVLEEREIINQDHAGEMLYVNVNKLYKFSPAIKTWKLNKEWPMESAKRILSLHQKILPYGNIIGIHSPKPNSNFHLRSFATMTPSSCTSLSTRAVRLSGQLSRFHFQSAPARALLSFGILAKIFF